MKKKLIFLDIDGTLTEPGTNIPPVSAQEAVKQARNNGHKIFLCSGRNYGMLLPLLQYGFDGVVCSAGGCILCDGQLIYDCPMTPEQQTKAMAVLAEHGIFRTAESFDNCYTDEGLKAFLKEKAHDSENSELLRWREQVENELGIRPMSEYQGEPVYKILIMAPNADCLKAPILALGDEFQFCLQEPDAYGAINGELINRKFHKGIAVRRVSEHLRVPIEDTIAFGDSMNDLEMVQTAGLGVCMANGAAALKEAADAVCPSVGEDGLYRAFQEYGLI